MCQSLSPAIMRGRSEGPCTVCAPGAAIAILKMHHARFPALECVERTLLYRALKTQEATMAIEIRKDGHQPTTTAIARPREPLTPFKMMRELMNWDPFREMSPALSQMQAELAPSFDIKETKDNYIFKADVPGIKESDLDVTMTGNRLTIAGKRDEEKEDKGDRYYTYERSYGSFSRSFTLPEGVDTSSVHADLKDGVLTLTIHKTQEAQAKKIAVQTAAKKS